MKFSSDIHLYRSQVGLALKAILFADGVQVGDALTTGFRELGLGGYSWETEEIPDDFTGIIRYYDADDNLLTHEAYQGTVIVDLSGVEASLAALQGQLDDVETKTSLIGTTGVSLNIQKPQTGQNLTIYVDNYNELIFSNLGSLANRTGVKLYFTVKDSLDAKDSRALLQIKEVGGLLMIQGVAPQSPVLSTDGAITVTDEDAGNLRITLSARAAALLKRKGEIFWDIKKIVTNDVDAETITSGEGAIEQPVTRAIS